jgi:hypothetical protein
MTIGDVNEQGYCIWLVMFMDRRNCFDDVNEKVYFIDVNKLGEWQLVMLMNRSIVFDWWCSWIGGIIFGDVNEEVYFSDVIELGKWQLVMLMNRSIVSIGDVNGQGVSF